MMVATKDPDLAAELIALAQDLRLAADRVIAAAERVTPEEDEEDDDRRD